MPGLIRRAAHFCVGAALSVSTVLTVGAFLAGLFTVAQFSFWGNYLPRVYPVHLRGTGEGFAANIGGRMIGTSFASVTNTIAVQAFVPGELAAGQDGLHRRRRGTVRVPGRHHRLLLAAGAAASRGLARIGHADPQPHCRPAP